MLKFFLKSIGISSLTGFVFFLFFASGEAQAQAGEYDLRLIQESVDCNTRKVTFSAQIRASEAGGEFILGSSSILFTTQSVGVLSNPTLASIDGFSGGRYGTLTLSEQSPNVSLNILYSGVAPFTDVPNVTTNWTSIAHITFDVASPSDGCYVINWNSADDFPGTDVLKVVLTAGTKDEIPAVAGTFTNATGCAFAGLAPVATIAGDTTIQAGQQATLKINFTGETPVSLAVNGTAYSNLTQSPLLVPVSPTTTTTYTLASVSNACGAGTGSGSATVTVSDPGTIATQNLASATACAGSTVPVSFTTTGTPGAGNVYTVQLSDATGSNFAPVSTTGTSSPLSAVIPAGTAPGAGYRVRVVSSNPAVVGSPSAAFTVPAPATALLSGGATVPVGGSASLSVQLTGSAPWTVTLSNSVAYTASASPLAISVTPATTTTYTVASVTDACGAGTGSGSATVTVSDPGTIATQNLASATVCAGSTVPVTFTTTGTPGAGNVYTVQLSDATGSNFAPVSTTGTSSPLSAVIPAGTAPGAGYRVRVMSSNPAVVGSPSAAFTVPAPATALLSGGATVPVGGSASLSVQLTGSAPWTVTLSNSVAYTASASPLAISVTPATTTTYTVASVTDACGAGTGSGSATVTVQPADDLCNTICVPVSFVIVKW